MDEQEEAERLAEVRSHGSQGEERSAKSTKAGEQARAVLGSSKQSHTNFTFFSFKLAQYKE